MEGNELLCSFLFSLEGEKPLDTLLAQALESLSVEEYIYRYSQTKVQVHKQRYLFMILKEMLNQIMYVKPNVRC